MHNTKLETIDGKRYRLPRWVIFEGRNKTFQYEVDAMRPPRKGEFYLSGAVLYAYKAPNDLTTPYIVVRPIEDR